MKIKNYKIKISCILISFLIVLCSFTGCARKIKFMTGQWSADNIRISDTLYAERITLIAKESSFDAKDVSATLPDGVLLSNGQYLDLDLIFYVDGIEKRPDDLDIIYSMRYLQLFFQYEGKEFAMFGYMWQDGKEIYIEVRAWEVEKNAVTIKFV